MAECHPEFITAHTHAIAFDRRGTGDIITKQFNQRCCSEVFAADIAQRLQCENLQITLAANSNGDCTDTLSYAHLVHECSNISSGYSKEHSGQETLDVTSSNRTESPTTMNIAAIAEQLAHTGYIVLDQPLLATQSAQLSARCQDDEQERFHPAQIGRGLAKQRSSAIRGDVIRWLDDSHSIDHAYLVWMEELRIGLNAALYLGLFDYESHYAIYAAGAAYAKHSDVLAGKRNRILSTVLYLNDDWQASDGGELVLFAPGGEAIITTIPPIFGSMILFLSESFPHQVLTAHSQRRSIAGWFRVRASA